MKIVIYRLYISIFIICSFSAANAQVGIDKQVIMSGPTEQNRQILNVGTPTDLDHAATAGTIQMNYLNYATASGIDSIYFNLPVAPTSYTPGMIVYFKAASANTGPVEINIHQLGPVSVKKLVNEDLVEGDITSNQVVAVVYDGAYFQLVSNSSLKCPSGFTDVNGQYCIENNERVAAGFFTAQVTCFNLNARLCTWGEWYYACQNTNLSLTNMINNFEWTEDACNGPNNIRTAGGASCTAFGQNTVTANVPYRCCFSK